MDALEGVGDPELRATYAYTLARGAPVTTDDVAAAHGVHRNVARARLERLVSAGLLSSGYERRTGKRGPGAGRPAKTYAVVPRLHSIEFPDRGYDRLVRLLVDLVPARARSARLRDAGTAFAKELLSGVRIRRAGTLAVAAERVCEAMRALGFHANVAEAGETAVVIETATCPLRPLVVEDHTVAELDRGMWTGLTDAALQGAAATRVACDTQCCGGDGPCRVTLSLSQL